MDAPKTSPKLEAMIAQAETLLGEPAPADRSSVEFDRWLEHLRQVNEHELANKIFLVVTRPDEKKVAQEIKRSEDQDARSNRLKALVANKNLNGTWSPKPTVVLGGLFAGIAVGLILFILPKATNPGGSIAGAINFGSKTAKVGPDGKPILATTSNPDRPKSPTVVNTAPGASLAKLKDSSAGASTTTSSIGTPAKLPDSPVSPPETPTYLSASGSSRQGSLNTTRYSSTPSGGMASDSTTPRYAASAPGTRSPSVQGNRVAQPNFPPAAVPSAAQPSSVYSSPPRVVQGSADYARSQVQGGSTTTASTASVYARAESTPVGSAQNYAAPASSGGAADLIAPRPLGGGAASSALEAGAPAPRSSATVYARESGSGGSSTVYSAAGPGSSSSTVYNANAATPQSAPALYSAQAANSNSSTEYAAPTKAQGGSPATLYGTPSAALPSTEKGILFQRELPKAQANAAEPASSPNALPSNAAPGGGFQLPGELTAQNGNASAAGSAPDSPGATASVPAAPNPALLGSASQGAAPAKPLYTPGQQIKAKLLTKVVLTDGLTLPVLAKGEDDSLWIGVGTLDNLRRVQIKFTRVVIKGVEQPALATAFSPGGQPGLAARQEQVAPDLAGDLLKAGVGGVATYVQTLTNNRQITTNGATTQITGQVPGLLEQVGGALANAISGGRNNPQLSVVGVATVERETPLGIVYGL